MDPIVQDALLRRRRLPTRITLGLAGLVSLVAAGALVLLAFQMESLVTGKGELVVVGCAMAFTVFAVTAFITTFALGLVRAESWLPEKEGLLVWHFTCIWMTCLCFSSAVVRDVFSPMMVCIAQDQSCPASDASLAKGALITILMALMTSLAATILASIELSSHDYSVLPQLEESFALPPPRSLPAFARVTSFSYPPPPPKKTSRGSYPFLPRPGPPIGVMPMGDCRLAGTRAPAVAPPPGRRRPPPRGRSTWGLVGQGNQRLFEYSEGHAAPRDRRVSSGDERHDSEGSSSSRERRKKKKRKRKKKASSEDEGKGSGSGSGGEGKNGSSSGEESSGRRSGSTEREGNRSGGESGLDSKEERKKQEKEKRRRRHKQREERDGGSSDSEEERRRRKKERRKRNEEREESDSEEIQDEEALRRERKDSATRKSFAGAQVGMTTYAQTM